MHTRSLTFAIKAEPAQVWHALVDPAVSPAYYLGFSAEFDLTPGAPYRYTAGGGAMITGTVVEVEPERRLVTTFNGHWAPAVAALPESTVTFVLTAPTMPVPGVTLLSLRHDGIADAALADDLEQGWALILSGCKTLLETGAPLAVGA